MRFPPLIKQNLAMWVTRKLRNFNIEMIKKIKPPN